MCAPLSMSTCTILLYVCDHIKAWGNKSNHIANSDRHILKRRCDLNLCYTYENDEKYFRVLHGDIHSMSTTTTTMSATIGHSRSMKLYYSIHNQSINANAFQPLYLIAGSDTWVLVANNVKSNDMIFEGHVNCTHHTQPPFITRCKRTQFMVRFIKFN